MTEHSANDHDCAEGTKQPTKLQQADPTEELATAERDYRFMRTGLDLSLIHISEPTRPY